MKIVDIKTTVVNVPMKPQWLSSLGIAKGTTRTIIKVLTDDGITGLGEAPFDSTKKTIDEELRPVLLGEDPFNLELIFSKCLPSAGSIGSFILAEGTKVIATSGIEIALLDIIGKSIKRPAYDLLGGKYRERIPFVEYFAPWYEEEQARSSGPKDIQQFCAERIKYFDGKVLEGKVGIFSPKIDIEMVRAIRESIGYDINLRIDANMAWSLSTAIKTIKAMEKYELENVEEPTKSLYSMEKVKEKTSVPLSTHSLDIPRIVETNAADNIACDFHGAGGILRTKKLVAIAEAYDLGFWLRSDGELGISTAAMLHLVASTPYMSYPNQSLIHYLTDDIIKNKFLLQGGCIEVPKKPGLGVEIDEDKVKLYEELYRKEGPYDWNKKIESFQ